MAFMLYSVTHPCLFSNKVDPLYRIEVSQLYVLRRWVMLFCSSPLQYLLLGI